MKSKWFHLKENAIGMRKQGVSIREVEKSLGIPRSTLSNWFKNITLSEKHKQKLTENWRNAIIKARKAAVLWHNSQKEERLKNAREQALDTLANIDLENKKILELALAMLYLGEGFKTQSTGMGNSNPLLLKFFISALLNLYNYNMAKIKCELHLRADQDQKQLKRYWSNQLGIPLKNFTNISVDKRTMGSKTYPTYKGVCVVRCGNIALQRKLVYLSHRFCEEIINKRTVSSVGRASA